MLRGIFAAQPHFKKQKEWESNSSVAVFFLLSLSSRWGGERKINLLKAPQTMQPFNKTRLIFPVFALVKWGIGFVRERRCVDERQPLIGVFICIGTGSKRANKIKYSPFLQVGNVPVLSLGSARVRVIRIMGLSCSQVPHGPEGLCELCHRRPINAHDYSCSAGKVHTKRFTQINASFLGVGHYSALWERFVNAHLKLYITGVTKYLDALESNNKPAVLWGGGIYTKLTRLNRRTGETSRRHFGA